MHPYTQDRTGAFLLRDQKSEDSHRNRMAEVPSVSAWRVEVQHEGQWMTVARFFVRRELRAYEQSLRSRDQWFRTVEE